jgi:hypothetical protein
MRAFMHFEIQCINDGVGDLSVRLMANASL